MDKNNNCFEGVVSANPKGFGFATTRTDEAFFISPPAMRELLPGDTVSFSLERGKKPGATQVARAVVVSRPETVWQGTLQNDQGTWVLEPDEACFVPIRVDDVVFACEGTVVSVRVPGFRDPTGRRGGPVHGKLERILGERTRPGFDADYALARHDFVPSFSSAALRHCLTFDAGELADERLGQGSGRANLTGVPFVTIDGESTRDFDDAVHAEALPAGGWLVRVAIADVGHYVRPGDTLDVEARSRGTSAYLPGRTVPMLPEVLSNGLCSLMPDQNRFAVVVDIELDAQAQVKAASFTRAVIRSAQRLTYNQVHAWSQGTFALKETVETSMRAMWAVYQLLAGQRKEQGRLDFEAPEVGLNFRPDGSAELSWGHRNDAHKLIEELMLLANQCAARKLLETAGAFFRHQAAPEAEDWERIAQWAATNGFTLPAEPSIPALAALFDSIAPENRIKAELQARSGMRPANYHEAQPSHFSLGFQAYTHFTSPIRRYADLVVHRLLCGEAVSPTELELLALHCSARSRAAVLVERDVWDKIKKRLMYRDVPSTETLKAHVVSQSRRGLRAVVGNWQTSVLVSGEELLEGGFNYDSERECWTQATERLEPGSSLNLRMVRIEEVKARTELHAELV